jgi:ribulose-phosphate 3-epimerase
MNNRIKIAPSILSADFRVLEQEVHAVEQAGADMIHCDVMDGMFVPNITFGPMVVGAVKKCVSVPLDVHLMIAKPGRYIDAFCEAGADILTVHAEECTDLPATIASIKKHGVKAGVTVNPDKETELFLDYLDQIDQVLIMSVYAGFGGQKFIPEVMDKVRTVQEEAEKKNIQVDIEVDGGINHETAAIAAEAGARVFVAGNYIFKNRTISYAESICAIRQAAEQAIAPEAQ